MAIKLYISDFIHDLKDAGFTDKQAEVLAKDTEVLMNQVTEESQRTLFTKEDAKELEIRLIKWVLATGITTIIAIAGLLKYMH